MDGLRSGLPVMPIRIALLVCAEVNSLENYSIQAADKMNSGKTLGTGAVATVSNLAGSTERRTRSLNTQGVGVPTSNRRYPSGPQP